MFEVPTDIAAVDTVVKVVLLLSATVAAWIAVLAHDGASDAARVGRRRARL
jgi:hypothetical protein